MQSAGLREIILLRESIRLALFFFFSLFCQEGSYFCVVCIHCQKYECKDKS